MPPDSAPPPKPARCCPVGSRPDLGEINAALIAAANGTGFESLNQIVARTGIRKPTLIDHRRKCLGIDRTIFTATAAPVLPTPELPAEPVRYEDLQTHADTPRRGVTVDPPGSATSTKPDGTPGSVDAGVAAVPVRVAPAQAQPIATGSEDVTVAAVATPPRLPPAPRVPPGDPTGDRIRLLANMITLDQWKDRASVVGMAAQWGCPEEEVERLHRFAAAKVAKNRGSFSAQLETSIASVRAMRDAERQDAERYVKEAQRAFTDGDHNQAKRARQLAAVARTQQLACQKHLDALTILKPQALTIQIGPSVDPEFQRAWATVRRILDALYPGASIAVEDGLAAWEDGRLDEWLAAETGIGSGRTQVIDTTGESVERAA